MTQEKERCKKCGTVIFGFSKKDLNWRMGMHDLAHRHKEEMAEENEKDK